MLPPRGHRPPHRSVRGATIHRTSPALHQHPVNEECQRLHTERAARTHLLTLFRFTILNGSHTAAAAVRLHFIASRLKVVPGNQSGMYFTVRPTKTVHRVRKVRIHTAPISLSQRPGHQLTHRHVLDSPTGHVHRLDETRSTCEPKRGKIQPVGPTRSIRDGLQHFSKRPKCHVSGMSVQSVSPFFP